MNVSELTVDFDKIIDDKITSFSNEGHKCKPALVDYIIDVANRDLSLTLLRPLKHEIRKQFVETHDTNYENSLNNFGYEFSVASAKLNGTQKVFVDYKCKDEENLQRFKNNASNFELPETSFLVAIFESRSNTTAHTCAGTLLSPNWVLTSASCIDVLGYLENGTVSTNQSVYTIIAGAINPMIDGSAHNVTRVLLHHGLHVRIANNSSKTSKNRNSGLAMLRINPAAALTGLEIFPSWGGGVVATIGRQPRLLAVTHAGEQAVSATDVYAHAAWIQAVLTDNAL
ncbi:unnamed protein product [Diatraea saccharalis]|uniref:Peptidase S1 domain-containing protein n=1 Tax=Diatraea saccharalis TaxID=40085 RepID=A0A9N9R0H2_9NEOP|nr:unnamed protein product [Diatraea saccharalis]